MFENDPSSRVFSTRLDFVTPQRQRPLPATETGIDAAGVANLRPCLASTPNRCLPCEAVAALGTGVLLVRDLRRVIVVYVRVDELLRA